MTSQGSTPDTAKAPGDQITFRPAEDCDGPGVLALVGRCFADYPGCVLDAVNEEAALQTPASCFPWFLVAERDGWIVGTVAGVTAERPHGEVWTELKKLYVHPKIRGARLGSRLIDALLEHARAHRAVAIDLWSDTRFLTAHAVYEHLGWERRPETRLLHDLSNTEELYFVRRLTPATPA